MSPLRTQIPIETRTPALPPGDSSAIENQKSKIENCLDFISSDSTLDRYSEIITPAGWKLDSYLRNPVFQNAHQYGDIIYTLGRGLITEVRSLPSPALFQRIQFAVDANPMAKIAHALYAGGFLRAVSVGFRPIRWEEPSNVAPGEGGGSPPGTCRKPRRRYLEQELLEVSAVAIPANPNALALALKSGALEKSDLKDTADLLRQLSVEDALDQSSPQTPSPDLTQAFELAHQIHSLLKRL